MTAVTNRVLLPPKNWQDFERLCYDLYRRRWNSNDAEMHGRQGQPQSGVDIFGRDQFEGGKLVGVQCKGKDQTYGEVLTERQLRIEIDKAKSFIPKLEIFVVATTAPNDVRIQEAARIISEAHRSQGLFEVRVQGWDTLQQLISDYRDLLEKHFPDLYPPSELLARIDLSIGTSRQEGDTTRAEIAKLNATITAHIERREPNDPLQARIVDAAKLSEDGSARAALRALRRIQRDEGVNLSGRNLYRMYSGIGFAHLALGDQPMAIEAFRAAFAADPDFPNARAIFAIAELLEGNKTQAFERAKDVIAADPTSYHAAAVILDAAPQEVGFNEINGLIPVGLRDRVDILIAFSLRAQKGGELARAEEYARQALARGPTDLRAMSALASVLMEPVVAVEGVAFTGLVPPEFQARLEEALQLLERAWGELRTRDDIARYDHLAINLIVVLDLSGREAEAERILDEALRVAPRSLPLLRRYSLKMAEAGEWQAVLTALASIPEAAIEPQDEVIEAHALLRIGNPQDAVIKARALHEKYGETRSGEAAAALRLEAAAESGCLNTELDSTLARMPKSILLRSVAANLLKPDDPRRDTLLAEIENLVSDLADPRDRFHAAEALYQAKQFRRSADLYGGLYSTDRDDISLQKHLMALYLSDDRQAARQLFERLSDPVKALPQYAELGAMIYERSGLLEESRRIIEQYLLGANDLHWRLIWLSLCERLGDTSVIVGWLGDVRADQKGRPRDLITLALAIDRYLGDQKCLPIAYRALREAYDDPQVHLGYTVGLFLNGRIGRIDFQTPSRVRPDTAVVLTEKEGERRLVRVIETEPNPRIEQDEIKFDDSLAARLIGLQVGDEIELSTLEPMPVRFVVSAIQNKSHRINSSIRR